MNQVRWLTLANILIASGVLLILAWLHKPVTLIIDGESTEITTYCLRVGELLQRMHVEISVGDQVTPDVDHWIRAGEVIRIRRASVITIRADGETTQLVNSENNPANLLVIAGVRLYPGDQIWVDSQQVEPDSELSPAPHRLLEVRRQWPVTVVIGQKKRTFNTRFNTLGEALWEAGYRLYANDTLTIPLDTPLNRPLSVQIRPSKSITIHYKDGLFQTRTSADTVGEALARAGMPLQGIDYSLPAADDPIPQNGEIRVVRVRESIEIETSPIPFETHSQPSPDLPLDQQQVVQEGIIGLKATRLRLHFEDGEEVARTLEGEYIARQPTSRILGFGTKIVPQTLDTPDGSIKYWRALNMYAVSYNPTSNGGYGTASGIPLAKGVAAIDNDYIPFGTRMYIPGYGIAVAADTGGGVIGRMIDLGYSDHDYVSWHQWVTVYFLWPPPENVPWIIP